MVINCFNMDCVLGSRICCLEIESLPRHVHRFGYLVMDYLPQEVTRFLQKILFHIYLSCEVGISISVSYIQFPTSLGQVSHLLDPFVG